MPIVFYLQLFKDFLLGLELLIWLALLIALYKYPFTRSRADRRIQRFNLAACPFSGKTQKKRQDYGFPPKLWMLKCVSWDLKG